MEGYPQLKLSMMTYFKITAKLDLNKAHGHNKISVLMIEICSASISKPLRLIFNHCLDNGIYPWEWKKANVVQFTKKVDKQILKNYRSVPLFPICSKSFERFL